ncbi:MAG: permease [Actinomycetota bacterium]|nr:permease [Actinomycetota bacterium]
MSKVRKGMAPAAVLQLRSPIPVISWSLLALVSGALVFAVRVFELQNHSSVQTFAIVFTAIAVEALPFVLLGAFVSALMEVYVPDRAFARWGRLPVGLQLPAAAAGGFFFPVCECGSVPVARRLIAKGMHPSAGLAFMIAAPIFNPVVLGSTWVAYEARGLGLEMVLGRGALGLVVALVAGWAIGADRGARLLKSGSEDGSHEPVTSERGPSGQRMQSLAANLTSDFLYMGRFLILGAAVAAAMQALVPQNVLSGAASSPLIATAALMVVAFASSLCSEADAFVAVSFTPFPLGSQLAFLVFGPVLDLKLLFLYGAVFQRKLIVSLAMVAIPVTVAGSLWFEVLLR